MAQWEHHWPAWWEQTRQECRSLTAAYLGVPAGCVALMGSFGEAAATVAASLPPGRVVVGAKEYRSNLFPGLPWTAVRTRWSACTARMAGCGPLT